MVSRAIWAGRAPWGNMHEFSLACALAVSGVFLGMSVRRDLRYLGLAISMIVLLALGVAVLLLYNESATLVPALHSYGWSSMCLVTSRAGPSRWCGAASGLF